MSKLPSCLVVPSLVLVLVLASGHGEQMQAQLRGSQSFGDHEGPAPWYSASYALLIGVSDYTNGWSDLPSVARELDQVEAVLLRHGFEVLRISDPDGEELEAGFRGFIKDHGYSSPDDRLIVFFSGHGHTEVTSFGRERGYLVPSDAPLPETDLEEFKRTASA